MIENFDLEQRIRQEGKSSIPQFNHSTEAVMTNPSIHPKFKRYRANDDETKNEWYRCCREYQIPCIKIEDRNTYSDVEFDYITFDPSVDPVLEKSQVYIKQRMFELFRMYRTHRSEVNPTPGLIKISNVRKEDAEDVALAFHRLITDILAKIDA